MILDGLFNSFWTEPIKFGQIWQCLVFNQEVVEIPQSSASVSVSVRAAVAAFTILTTERVMYIIHHSS